MWTSAVIGLVCFIGGVSVALFCVFMNTVVDDIRNAARTTQQAVSQVQVQMSNMVADSATKYNMVMHELDKLQKQVKAIPVVEAQTHSEANLDSRSV